MDDSELRKTDAQMIARERPLPALTPLPGPRKRAA